MDKLDILISQALREVEKDLSLPSNSLVDDTPAQRSSGKVKRKKTVVLFRPKFYGKGAGKCDPTFKEAR